MTKNDTIIISIILILLISAGLYFYKIKEYPGLVDPELAGQTNEPQRITATGIYTCLPHKDTSGPQTLECATGIKAQEGYYGLNFVLSSQTIPELKTGDKITVSGVFSPAGSSTLSNLNKYDILGVIAVTDSTIIVETGSTPSTPPIATNTPQEPQGGVMTPVNPSYPKTRIIFPMGG